MSLVRYYLAGCGARVDPPGWLLFRAVGYEDTTRRAVTEPAGAVIGNADPRERRSVLVRIDDVLAGHRDADRAESVDHPDGAGVGGQDVGQPLVDVRALVGAGAAQLDAGPADPLEHHLPGDLAAEVAAG